MGAAPTRTFSAFPEITERRVTGVETVASSIVTVTVLKVNGLVLGDD